MQNIQVINPARLVNFDQCSTSAGKYRSIRGRGNRRVIINEWNIGGISFSAMAALTPLGFIPCTHIIERIFSYVEVIFIHRNLYFH